MDRIRCGVGITACNEITNIPCLLNFAGRVPLKVDN